MGLFKKRFPFINVSERLRKITAAVVFWLWNLLALSLIFFGLIPHVLVGMIRDAARGLIPWNLTFAILCLGAIPLLSAAWGIGFFRSPGKLLAMFYGLEVPLCLVCLFRIFLIRELTPAVTLVAVAFFVSCASFGYELARNPGSRPWGHLARLAGHSVAAMTSLYLGAVLGFYVPVVAVAAVKGFFGFAWIRPLGELIARGQVLFFLMAILFGLSAALFVAAPIALIALHSVSFVRVYRRCRLQVGKVAPLVTATATAAAMLGLFMLLNRQPHRRAFDLLSRAPATDAERTRLLASAAQIRTGLVEAYLSPYRYLSARGENNHLRRLYDDVLGMPPGVASACEAVQKGLLAPFLYDGESMTPDRERAERLYADFFDTPLQRKERSSVLAALATTWNRDERSAGLLNQDQRRVKLTKQEVRVDERGQEATIEIHDRYQNQTHEVQEIFISFSLPESAAVTGLWLGNSDERDKRFSFQVSPRGAAQKVYRAEVARRADPALVEQVGPGQYRLRAFPVPAAPEKGPAPSLHLWMTYVARPDSGHWPVPHLTERRNVYWDDSTERDIRGMHLRREQSEWVGPELPVNASAPDVAEEAVLPGGYWIRREPLVSDRLPRPKGRAFAVVVDRSYSMTAVQAELHGTMAEIAQLAPDNDVDVYFAGASTRGEAAERQDDVAAALRKPLLFYGGGSVKLWLRQFDELRAGKIYDAAFVLTDGDTLDSSDDSAPPSIDGALWMVHLGGHLAAGYDDPMLELVNRSGGGVTTSLGDAVRRYAARQQDDVIINVEGNSIWTMQTTSRPETPIDNFALLSARQLILALGRHSRDTASLDQIHALAVKYREVSAYSSMIVLVDDLQRQALEKAEAESDRFDRKVEPGKEVLSTPMNPLSLTATPEPHEWVLIGLAMVAVIFVLRRRAAIASRLAPR